VGALPILGRRSSSLLNIVLSKISHSWATRTTRPIRTLEACTMANQGPDCKRRECLVAIFDFVLRYMLEHNKSNEASKAQHLCSHLLRTTLGILALSRKLEKANCVRYAQNRTLFPRGWAA